MRNFNRFSRDDNSRGRSSYGRSSSGNRDYERPQMHKAVCDECGRDCEVPFKPSGDKQIFCSSCFEKRNDSYQGNRNNFNRNDSYQRRDRSDDNEMFSAVCDECGGIAKLPFKPSSNKPVYCSNCFNKRGEAAGLHDNKGKDSGKMNAQITEVKDQINALTEKIDMIMQALKIESVTIKVSKEDYLATQQVEKEEVKKEVKAKKEVKKEKAPKKEKTVKKKAAVKKSVAKKK